MKKVLYLTNIAVPYRVRFFNELAKHCDLTVLYEREKSGNRNDEWAKSERANHHIRYLNGIKVSDENGFSLRIFKEIFSHYDRIVVGCYNSPVQLLAILVMRLFHIPYCLNLDGESFLESSGLKSRLKRFAVSGADTYLVAGERAAASLRKAISGNRPIVPYYFSSLSEQELLEHRKQSENCRRNGTVLVVGQYADYKGLDIALEAARMDPSISYRFVGMGSRTERFIEEHAIPENVEIIPFLQKQELEKEYMRCAMLVLPSRRECWGLVINEAASFGIPIVSTWGSGAAVEYLRDRYPQFLATPGDASSLLTAIKTCIQLDEAKKNTYSCYLLEKSQDYSIEKSVDHHMAVLNSTCTYG